jgi:hypothetical protein
MLDWGDPSNEDKQSKLDREFKDYQENIRKNKKANDPFKAMFEVFKSTNVEKETKDKIPSYMFCKWLSGSPYTVQAANFINTHYSMPESSQFDYIREKFSNKKMFIKFPKNTKNESEEIELLARHFQINMTKAKEYLGIINKDELQQIKAMYEDGKK